MKLSEAKMKQLKEHSKKHKGGMMSKHMKNMKKFMEAGDAFIVAHNKAVKEDKMMKKNKNKNNILYRYIYTRCLIIHLEKEKCLEEEKEQDQVISKEIARRKHPR